MKTTLLLALVLVCVGASTASAQIAVIANPSVGTASVDASELKDVFLGSKNKLADGSAVEPVLGPGGGAHEEFLKEVVGKSDQALRTHFKSLVFTGKGSMPKSFASDGDVVSYVAKTKGAIGYVSASSDASGVKKLTVK
jgi:ABC-type phosphate transport system substrate-binding protein